MGTKIQGLVEEARLIPLENSKETVRKGQEILVKLEGNQEKKNFYHRLLAYKLRIRCNLIFLPKFTTCVQLLRFES